MAPFNRAFRDHPASVGESYLEHMRAALSFSYLLARAALCCGIHALLPFLFQRTGSLAIEDLHRRMVRQRHVQRLPEPAPPCESSSPGSRAAA